MTSYRIYRDDTGSRVYDGRDDFITGVVDRDGALLCSAIATVMAAERGRASASDDDNVKKDDEAVKQDEESGYWRGFPWLTPVLGSGCLRSPADGGLTPSSLAAGVAARLRTIAPVPAGSEAWETIGHRFTQSLAQRRLRESDDEAQAPDASSDEVADVDELAARLVLIAALLTRFCHAARAIDPTAIGRMSDEVVTFRFDRPTVDDPYRLGPTVIAPLKDQLWQVSGLTALPLGVQDRTGEVLKAVKALANSLLNELNRNQECRVSLNSVRLATEAAWYFLVSRTDEYYGWTELLLGLILREPNPQNSTYRRKRPRYNDLQAFPNYVGRLFEAPTEARWRQLGRTLADRSADADMSVHRAVARVLTAQASAAAESKMLKGDRALPLPVAYSTSFDIELAMELWALRQDYSVALPVHVARPEGAGREEVDLCWLVGDVDYDDRVSWERGLDRVRHPTNWQLLAHADLPPTRPVVVHLTGCPLYGLEELADGTEERRSLAASLDEAGLSIGRRSILQSAVTIDEYLALRQSEIELFWAVGRSTEAQDMRSRGLNPRLSRDGQLGGGVNRRYWIALGVPVGDPALRHRVMSPLTARWISEMAGRPGPPDEAAVTGAPQGDALTALRRLGSGRPESVPHNGGPADGAPGAAAGASLEESLVGVAVNARVDEDEAFLLSWLGLSVVRGQAVDFVPDLLDYERHIRTQGRFKRLQQTECSLQTGHRR